MAFAKLDIAKRLGSGQTDIPRLREGGVKAQFWSVYIPSEHANPARTVPEQIDLVHRMVDRYPDDLAMAYSADDVERAVKAGKIASLIGIEGGRGDRGRPGDAPDFARLGARYMTLTHNKTLAWADAATDDPKHDGLTPFGERVVREMNRLGMLVDISHVSPATMADVLRVSKAPVIASHSSARAVADHPRNVPDEVLKLVPANGGVIMVNFYSGFIVPEAAKQSARPAGAQGQVPRPGRLPQSPRRVQQDPPHAPGDRRHRGRPHRAHHPGRRRRPRRDRLRLRRRLLGPRRPRRRVDLPSAHRGTPDRGTPRPTSTRSSAATSSAPSARPARSPRTPEDDPARGRRRREAREGLNRREGREGQASRNPDQTDRLGQVILDRFDRVSMIAPSGRTRPSPRRTSRRGDRGRFHPAGGIDPDDFSCSWSAASARVHPDRAAGGDRDHRGPDRPAAARGPGRPRGGPADAVRQQPEADWPWRRRTTTTSSRDSRSAGSATTRSPATTRRSSYRQPFVESMLPFIEQGSLYAAYNMNDWYEDGGEPDRPRDPDRHVQLPVGLKRSGLLQDGDRV